MTGATKPKPNGYSGSPAKNGHMSNVRHIVVARAASSVRFAPEEAFTFSSVPAGNLRAAIIVRTRYSVEGFTKPVPRELWIEASGEMSSFDQAIVDLTNASAMVLPAIAFCANAPIEEPEPEMAYELHDGETSTSSTSDTLRRNSVFRGRGGGRRRRRSRRSCKSGSRIPKLNVSIGRSCNTRWL